jgi:pectate lyase C
MRNLLVALVVTLTLGACTHGGQAADGSGTKGAGSELGITGATCKSTGDVTIAETVRVSSGVFDGECRTYNATGRLGDGSQRESQEPAFIVENGATLRNVILGKNGVDGVHFYNGGIVENFTWTDVGEDAFTVKTSGVVNLTAISGFDASDKFGQINAPSTVNISNCIVESAGKFIRQNGRTTFPIVINVDRCRFSNFKEAIFRTDSPVSEVYFSNSRIRGTGTTCMGPWKVCQLTNVSSYFW